MSQRSMLLGAPRLKIMMQARSSASALTAPAAWAANHCGRPKPIAPSVPACKKSRRLTPLQVNVLPSPVNLSMRKLPVDVSLTSPRSPCSAPGRVPSGHGEPVARSGRWLRGRFAAGGFTPEGSPSTVKDTHPINAGPGVFPQSLAAGFDNMIFPGNDPTVTASGQVAAAQVGTTALIEVGAAGAGANPLAVVRGASTKHSVARHKTKAAHHRALCLPDQNNTYRSSTRQASGPGTQTRDFRVW